MPGDEHSKYLPTQVVAEYLASEPELKIDGITITHHDSAGKIVAEWATWDTQSLLQSAAAPQIFEQLSVGV